MNASGYLKDLINQKQNIVNILNSQGFSATNDEKFNTLMPKLKECVEQGISESEADVTFANVVKQNVSGEVIAVNDVSSIKHNLKIQLISDAVTDFSNITISRYGSDETDNLQTVKSNADGVVNGITSLSPNMTLTADTDGVIINCTYNTDTKTYIDNKNLALQTAILEAGGS